MKNMLAIIILLSIILTACQAKEVQQEIMPANEEPLEQPAIEETVPEEPIIEEAPEKPLWKKGGMAISGSYADADIVYLGNGQYRMYYAIEPEVQGNQLEVYSALSTDGITWAQEQGVRRKFTTFPDVLQLPDGKWRMYFQEQNVIKSAISTDGLKWEDESGTRIDTANHGIELSRVLAPTTIYLDGTYVMVYAGAIQQKYKSDVPNQETHWLYWATSTDGLNFEKKGIAVESRNERFQGWLDGPDLVKWDDGSVRLHFWSYDGISHATFENNEFNGIEFDYYGDMPERDPNAPPMLFLPNPPGDPTAIKINDKWHMYYGLHTQGIFYATLE